MELGSSVVIPSTKSNLVTHPLVKSRKPSPRHTIVRLHCRRSEGKVQTKYLQRRNSTPTGLPLVRRRARRAPSGGWCRHADHRSLHHRPRDVLVTATQLSFIVHAHIMKRRRECGLATACEASDMTMGTPVNATKYALHRNANTTARSCTQQTEPNTVTHKEAHISKTTARATYIQRVGQRWHSSGIDLPCQDLLRAFKWRRTNARHTATSTTTGMEKKPRMLRKGMPARHSCSILCWTSSSMRAWLSNAASFEQMERDASRNTLSTDGMSVASRISYKCSTHTVSKRAQATWTAAATPPSQPCPCGS